MVKMSKVIPEQPMGEACPLHRGANLRRRQASVPSTLWGRGRSAVVNSLSGFHMGMLRQICFHFVAYDFVQLTWTDSMWIKTDAFQGAMPGSLIIFFVPYQTVFLYPGKTADLSVTRKMQSLCQGQQLCVPGQTSGQGRGAGSGLRLTPAGTQIRCPGFRVSRCLL